MNKVWLVCLLTLGVMGSWGASLADLSGLGEDRISGGAASIGRGHSGHALLQEGFSFMNPSALAFDQMTRFSATLNFEVVYHMMSVESLGRDQLNLGNVTFSVPLGRWGTIGLGYWQRTTLDFEGVSLSEDGETQSSLTVDGSLMELASAYAVRLPGNLRSVALSVAWFVPTGHSNRSNVMRVASDQLDSNNQWWLDDVELSVEEEDSWKAEHTGYAGFGVHVHRSRAEFYVNAQMPHRLIRTQKVHLQTNRVDTTTASTNQASFKVPWRLSSGMALEISETQSVSLDFQNAAYHSEKIPGGSLTQDTQRMLALGWQSSGSNLFFDSFFDRNTFRAGTWLREWYLKDVWEVGASLGMGIPLGNKGAMLDFAISGGFREISEADETNETFLGLSFEFTGVGEWGKSARTRR